MYLTLRRCRPTDSVMLAVGAVYVLSRSPHHFHEIYLLLLRDFCLVYAVVFVSFSSFWVFLYTQCRYSDYPRVPLNHPGRNLELCFERRSLSLCSLSGVSVRHVETGSICHQEEVLINCCSLLQYVFSLLHPTDGCLHFGPSYLFLIYLCRLALPFLTPFGNPKQSLLSL